MLLTSPLSSPLKNPVRDVFSPAGSSQSLTAQVQALFAGGKVGGMWDMGDTSTLFQDIAATSQITAGGQQIARLNDLSGSGNHATQSTAGMRPIYNAGDISGGRFNGAASTSLATPAINLSGVTKAVLLVSFKNSLGTAGAVVNFGHGIVGGGYFSLATETNNIRTVLKGTIENPSRKTWCAWSDVPHVVSLEVDVSAAATAGKQISRHDGDTVNFVPAFNDTGTATALANTPLVFGEIAGSEKLTGDIYRAFLISGPLSAQEFATAYAWVSEPARVTRAPASAPVGVPNFVGVYSYGQSLALGNTSVPPISTTQRFSNVMLNGGARPYDTIATPPFWSIRGLVEAANGSNEGETPVSGITEMLCERDTAVGPAFSGQYFGQAFGAGGNLLSALGRFTQNYEKAMALLIYARRRATQMGGTYKLYDVAWIQGEADVATATYATDLVAFRTNLNTDVKTITKQTDDVYLIGDQKPVPTIALQQISAQAADAKIRYACPLYHIPHNGDGIHLTATGSKILGAYIGLARHKLINEGNTSWLPLIPVSTSIAGAVVDVTYAPVGNLVFDTTTVPAQTNYGFYLFTSGGSPITINSVAIVGANVVRITAAAPVSAGSFLHVGFVSATRTTINAEACNLRDSQGDTVVFNGGGLNYPMHNWALMTKSTL